MIYVDGDGVHRESDAVIRICRRLGGWWRYPAMIRFVPRGLRDAVYRRIARSRYDWFGRLDACRIPDDDGRFLP